MDIDWQAVLDAAWNFGRDQVPRIVGVLVALFVAWIVAGMVKRALLRGFEKANFDKTLSRFISNMSRYAILVFSVLGCLGVFGVETSSFAAVIAAAGLAVGLAFQGTLSNFAAGVMLLVFRPFKIGDVVDAGGAVGAIAEIDLFTTEMTTVDNQKVIVPNSSIFGGKIVNVTGHPQRRVDIDVGTDYGADLQEVRDVLEAMAPKIEGVLSDPPPQIFLKSLGGSSIDWQVRVWCNTEDYWDVWQRTTHQTKDTLDKAGVGIPFPQMDVHLDGGLKNG
ncbi:MAG: mechanosensitive ion channel family protein [Sandaracinaceae bacterium]